MKKIWIILLLTNLCVCATANTYFGKVIDEQGTAVGFATVYLEAIPEIGTATNNNGLFEITCNVHESNTLIVSFIGYEKKELTLADFNKSDTLTIVLKEQPIALQETVIEGKRVRHKNKRKQMSELLYKVYNQMLFDFPDENCRYTIVSDVRMDADDTPWGMEQMIADVVCLTEKKKDGRDSLQFAGKHCKRFFNQSIRNRANEIYSSGELDSRSLKAASAVDSGVVVHQALWGAGNIRYDFEKFMSYTKHWEVTRENDGETVLTHTEKHNYLGLFKSEMKRHYIVNSDTYRVQRFSEEATASVSIPFGYKLKGVYLDMLNLLNMTEERIEKFRIRRGYGTVKLNTIYQTGDNGKIYLKEKNLVADVKITSTKKQDIPLHVKATQRAISIQTANVLPMNKNEITRRIKREIVEIY